ncbi:uncharacterized protein G2W53_041804 [Senna tora]|uniref:Uncharacterized protein n=1 Tax=Senna tora TaxID=362788 RepID=A0A834SI10_9FABA|nr:uncharacterized protein G2W53_041804 [Senna tora]
MSTEGSSSSTTWISMLSMAEEISHTSIPKTPSGKKRPSNGTYGKKEGGAPRPDGQPPNGPTHREAYNTITNIHAIRNQTTVKHKRNPSPGNPARHPSTDHISMIRPKGTYKRLSKRQITSTSLGQDNNVRT